MPISGSTRGNWTSSLAKPIACGVAVAERRCGIKGPIRWYVAADANLLLSTSNGLKKCRVRAARPTKSSAVPDDSADHGRGLERHRQRVDAAHPQTRVQHRRSVRHV